MENIILTETGIHIDDLGRIVIPRTIRKSAKIMEGEKLDLFLTNDGSIILRKSETTKVELSPIIEPEKIIYTFVLELVSNSCPSLIQLKAIIVTSATRGNYFFIQKCLIIKHLLYIC